MKNTNRYDTDNSLFVFYLATLVICAILVFLAENDGKEIDAAKNKDIIAENLELIVDNTSAIYCDSCGAHVHNWWYAENINDGEPVEVCEFCYNNYIENTATE